MIVSLNKLRDYAVHATDGYIGTVQELYFDEDTWAVRYLVVESRGWVSHQKTLVMPNMVDRYSHEEKAVFLSVTQKEVEGAPPYEGVKTVTREKEATLHEYYESRPYWYNPVPRGMEALSPNLPQPPVISMEKTPDEIRHEAAKSILHSTAEIVGYTIMALDGSVGHVDDFLVDIAHWKVRYMVVDTGNWLLGRKVILSYVWAVEIDWANEEMQVELTQDEIRHSPPYDPEAPIDREYEARLYAHYQRDPYWTRLNSA